MKEKKMSKVSAMVSQLLPELNKTEKELADSEDSVRWASGMTHYYSDGSVLRRTHGINLQVVNKSSVRCLTVVDDEYCLRMLSMIKRTFESAGIEFQIDPHTILQPFAPRPKDVPPYLKEIGEEPQNPDEFGGKPTPTADSGDYHGMEVV